MRREYGTREQAKREIFARYASFIYMGSGRYGFGAASEYYFDKPLASYTIEDAGRAALLAGIGKSPRDYAPAAGSPRPRQRRNQILALMARNGYIPEDARPAVPGRADRRRPPRAGEDRGARGDRARAGRAAGSTAARASRWRTCSRAGYECAPRSISGCRGSSTRPWRTGSLSTRSGIPAPGGSPRARWWCWPTRTRRSWPRRGAAALQPSLQPLLRLQPRDRLASSARLGDEATRLPGRVSQRPDARRHGAATSPSACRSAPRTGVKWIANYDAQFKGRIPARQALAESRNAVAVWIAQGIGMEKVIRTCRDLGFRTPLQPLHQHGARRVRGPAARARGRLSGHGLGAACGASRDRAGRPTAPAPSSTRHPEPPGSFPWRAWR